VEKKGRYQVLVDDISRFGTSAAGPQIRSSHFGIWASNRHSRKDLRTLNTKPDLRRVLGWKWSYVE
jgi:hypothetical protein